MALRTMFVKGTRITPESKRERKVAGCVAGCMRRVGPPRGVNTSPEGSADTMSADKRSGQGWPVPPWLHVPGDQAAAWHPAESHTRTWITSPKTYLNTARLSSISQWESDRKIYRKNNNTFVEPAQHSQCFCSTVVPHPLPKINGFREHFFVPENYHFKSYT